MQFGRDVWARAFNSRALFGRHSPLKQGLVCLGVISEDGVVKVWGNGNFNIGSNKVKHMPLFLFFLHEVCL